MARLNRVQKTRKEWRCGKCQKPIEVGSPMLYWGFRYGGTYRRHVTCEPEHWEYATNNFKRQALMRASDAVGMAQEADTAEDAAAALRDAISEVEGTVEEFRAALAGWDSSGIDGASDSSLYQTFETAAEELEEWSTQAESLAEDLEGMETECEMCTGDGTVTCTTCQSEDTGADVRTPGFIDCDACDGAGSFDCDVCSGTGDSESGPGSCNDCSGSGERECEECDGQGRKACPDCDGHGLRDCEKCDGTGTDDEWREKRGEIEEIPDVDF